MALTIRHETQGQFRAVVLGLALGLALTLASCAKAEPPEIGLEDAATIGAKAECDQLQVMEGEPSYYDSAAGFNCLQDEGPSGAIYFRIYDDPSAVEKVMDDWQSAIDSEAKILLSEKWFAIGPENSLETLFGSYTDATPTADVPPIQEMSERELNMSMCSSMTYEIIWASVNDPSAEFIGDYFDSFPGMQELRDDLLPQERQAELEVYADGDDLRGIVFLTQFDADIKEFCANSVP